MHISGGHAYLLRFNQPAEKELGKLGFYDNLLDTPYDWPNRPAGGVVDDGYVKLWVQNGLLQYFQDVIGAGSIITKVAGQPNQVTSATVNFAAVTGHPRDASLLDRDVRPGDVAKVRGVTAGGHSITLWTYVRALLGVPVASTVDSAYADVANPVSQTYSASVAFVSGPINCAAATADAAAYDGLTDGAINETYDLVVITGSAGGDYATATLRVISGSGLDDQAAVSPNHAGVPTPIGTHGLTVTFAVDHSMACSASASAGDVSADDLLPGQRWRVTVAGAFTEPVASSGGSYAAGPDTTYVVTVTRGGLWAESPAISVTTTGGTDLSGPTVVPAAATAVAVGTQGVTISFTEFGLHGATATTSRSPARPRGPCAPSSWATAWIPTSRTAPKSI